MKSFREVVRDALDASGVFSHAEGYADWLARELKDRLNAEGYAIHEARLCVRPGDASSIGRPLTDGERRAFDP